MTSPLRALLVTLVLAGAAVSSASARADGLPVAGVDVGASGVALPDGGVRFVTLPAGPNTLVARVARDGGKVQAARLLEGRLTIPAVAYDATADGLSADGTTLVLIRPRRAFPQRGTRLAILDAERLRVREVVSLPGDFSFDALSPSGSLLYLIQYQSPRDPTQYAVRVFDLRAGRLRPEPVVDPTEPDERMKGSPVTRAWSRDGRWAYTLYDGAGGAPFVHALDTSGRTARCIDLDGLAGAPNLFDLRLGVSGGSLRVLDGRETVSLVDLETLAVSEPKAAAPGATAGDGGSVPWLFLVAPAGGALLAAAAALALRLRRRTGAAAPRGT